ncbi:MAG: MerR family transcriptional regulator [Bacteroidaceae bacterium]|nr:MerR family transcriptional regulator [Bacteroidaceae bacterium]MBR6926801.1 MerR family transcriptional regulator [Bacteroidaceae bacterium]
MSQKDLKLFYSIAEVAEMFDVPETTLRFWERQFPKQIAPHKSGRNIRQYTAADIEKIRIIYNLVKVRGLKIAAARELLKKNKTGERQQSEVITRLQSLREELVSIREELNHIQ